MLVDGGPDPERLLLELDARDPAVGSPDRPRRADAPARGPRRRPRPGPGAVPGGPRLRARHARPGPGLGRVGRGPAATARPAATLAAGARLRLDEVDADGPVARDRPVPVEPASTGRGINDTSIVLLGEANGRRFLLTGDAEDDVDPRCSPGACRGSTSSRSPTTGARRRPAPRCWPQRGPAVALDLRRGRQRLRPPGALDPRAPARRRRPRVPHGPSIEVDPSDGSGTWRGGRAGGPRLARARPHRLRFPA